MIETEEEKLKQRNECGIRVCNCLALRKMRLKSEFRRK